MPYQQDATHQLNHRADNLADYTGALPGKWFIGVVDTQNRRIYVVPVNVYEGRGALDQNTLNNTNQRAMNRYSSGTASDRSGAQQPFASFPGNLNWLEGRPVGQTHHTCVALHYGAAEADCLGFTLIKIGGNNGDFAQVKFSSNSLNAKPNYEVKHNFSTATFAMGQKSAEEQKAYVPGTAAFNPGTIQMPPQWRDAILAYFRGQPFNIAHVVGSDD